MAMNLADQVQLAFETGKEVGRLQVQQELLQHLIQQVLEMKLRSGELPPEYVVQVLSEVNRLSVKR